MTPEEREEQRRREMDQEAVRRMRESLKASPETLTTMNFRPEPRYLWSVEVAEAVRSATAVVTSDLVRNSLTDAAERFLTKVYATCEGMVRLPPAFEVPAGSEKG